MNTAELDASPVRAVRNAMTVDVEDYFHVSVFDGTVPRFQWEQMTSRVGRNTRRLLDLFEEFGVHATFFVLGWVAEREPQLVQEIVRRGHEVASHGYAHRLVYDQTRAAFRADVRRAKQVIEDAAGTRLGGYRAPSFSVTPRSLWALEILIEEGYWYDASIFPIKHDRYGIPPSSRAPFCITRSSGSLVEVPGSTVRIGPLNLPTAGGGYFRILPYEWTRWSIARLNRHERRPAVFYLHPWEIDPDQPRLPAGFLSRFRHYCNLHKTESRLRSLLRDFQFGALGPMLKDQPLAVTAAGAGGDLPYVW